MSPLTLKKNPTEHATETKTLTALSFGLFANFFNWFVIFVCVAILAAGYWFLIRPKYQFVASNQEVLDEERQYEQKVAYLKQLNEIKNLYRRISPADKDKIDLILSVSKDVDALKIALLREVGLVARLNNARVENMEATVIDNSEGKFVAIADRSAQNELSSNLKLVSVTFTLTNVDYDPLKRILNRFEKSLRILDVAKIDFTPAKKEAKLQVFAYYLEQTK